VLANLSFLSAILPILFFVVFCIKKATKEVWVIFAYCTVSFIIDAFSNTPWGKEHKYLLWNLYSVFEFSFLSYFFYLIIHNSLIRVLIIAFSLIYLIVLFVFSKSDNDQFNSLISAIGSVIIIVLSLSYFMTAMKPTAEPVNILTSVFLIVIAIFIYVTSTLFLFLIASKLSDKEMHNYWRINDFSNILTNLILSTAFILYRYQHKKPPPENRPVDFTYPNDR
jgi:hypothetical protein